MPFSNKYIKECKILRLKCSNCNKIGTFAKENVNRINNIEDKEDINQEATDMESCQLNIWNVQLLNNVLKFTVVKNDFKRNLLVNNRLVKILIDTRAKVSVWFDQQVTFWGIYEKMKPIFSKIHPFNSASIKVTGTALCSVSFNNWAVPVDIYISPGSCDSILDGNKAEQLKIISFDKNDNHIFNQVLMIWTQEKDDEFIDNICLILKHYPHHFRGLRKLRN